MKEESWEEIKNILERVFISNIVGHQPEQVVRWEGIDRKRQIGTYEVDASIKLALFSTPELMVLETWIDGGEDISHVRHCKNPRIVKFKNLSRLSLHVEDDESCIRTDSPYFEVFMHLLNSVWDAYKKLELEKEG